MSTQEKERTGEGNASRTDAEEIEYQVQLINRILTVWFEIENSEPIFE